MPVPGRRKLGVGVGKADAEPAIADIPHEVEVRRHRRRLADGVQDARGVAGIELRGERAAVRGEDDEARLGGRRRREDEAHHVVAGRGEQSRRGGVAATDCNLDRLAGRGKRPVGGTEGAAECLRRAGNQVAGRVGPSRGRARESGEDDGDDLTYLHRITPAPPETEAAL